MYEFQYMRRCEFSYLCPVPHIALNNVWVITAMRIFEWTSN